MRMSDMVRKIVDANSFETPQWGVIRLKGVKVDGLNQEEKQRAVRRLGELVWRETVTIEIEGRELKPGCQAKVTLGKVNINEEMNKFLRQLGK